MASRTARWTSWPLARIRTRAPIGHAVRSVDPTSAAICAASLAAPASRPPDLLLRSPGELHPGRRPRAARLEPCRGRRNPRATRARRTRRGSRGHGGSVVNGSILAGSPWAASPAPNANPGRAPIDARIRQSPPRSGGHCLRNPGGVLLSQGATPQVPSALAGLTAVFGMGTGVSPPPWPPETVRSRGSSRDIRADPGRARRDRIGHP